MLAALAKRMFGSANDRYVKSLQAHRHGRQRARAGARRRSATTSCGRAPSWLRERLAEGETLDDLLPDAFATVREAAKRTLGQRHFDVQLMGGMVLHRGMIAEMKTGEGKTLVATLPSISTRSPARACTSSRSTTTWPGATPSGWARSTASSA